MNKTFECPKCGNTNTITYTNDILNLHDDDTGYCRSWCGCKDCDSQFCVKYKFTFSVTEIEKEITSN